MNEDLLLAVFVAVEGVHSFSAFMPSAFTIRTFVRDTDDIRQLRAGYLPALAFVILLASLVGAIRGRMALYLAVGMVTALFMVGLYEYSIQDRRRVLVDHNEGVSV